MENSGHAETVDADHEEETVGEPVAQSPSTSDEVGALSALLAGDLGGNEAVQQTTVAIIGIVLAYIGAVLFVVVRAGSGSGEEIPVGILAFIPLPIMLLQTLQMIWAAGVIRRAASAERIEAELFARTSLREEYMSGRLGSKATTSITDLRYIDSSDTPGLVAGLMSVLPYYGFYLVSAAFSTYILWVMWVETGADTIKRTVFALTALAYTAFGFLIAVAAARVFSQDAAPHRSRKVRRESWAVVLVGVSGLVLQFVQTEDPTAMILYFTVWAATVTTVVWPFVDTTVSPLVRAVARSAAIGSVLSGVVFWVAIFPVNGLGTQAETILANISLHALLPFAVVWRLTGTRGDARPMREEWPTVAFPLLYLAFSLILQYGFGIASPYVFLRPNGVSLWIACPLLLLLWYAVAFALRSFLARVNRRSPAHRQDSVAATPPAT